MPVRYHRLVAARRLPPLRRLPPAGATIHGGGPPRAARTVRNDPFPFVFCVSASASASASRRAFVLLRPLVCFFRGSGSSGSSAAARRFFFSFFSFFSFSHLPSSRFSYSLPTFPFPGVWRR